MPLSNAEKQARWREKHIASRRGALRIATLLMRRNWPEGHVEEIAAELKRFLSTAGVAALRRALKPVSGKEMDAAQKKACNATWLAWWLKEHPGKSAKDFRRLRSQERMQWQRAMRAKWKADWERDHPGEQWPEHMCGLSDREATDFVRWWRKRSARERSN
jgi:hypothetical protein